MNILLILLILTSCATKQRNETKLDPSALLPSWVYSPYDECSEEIELCATGEGQRFQVADQSALANLGSVFEVQISSELQSFSSSSQSFPWQASVSQDVNQSLSQSVNQILQSVQIKKRFKKDGLSYSLASLDKSVVSKMLLEKLNQLDTEILELWKKKQRTSFKKLFSLSLQKEKLIEKYSIVSSFPYKSSVTHSELIQWRATKPQTELITLNVGQAPDWLVERLKDLFSESGFSLGNEESKNVLMLNMSSIKEYLNVQGFEKFTFTLNLTSLINGKKQRDLSVTETVVGRNQQDALLKAKSFFNDYIEHNLSELNFD